MRLRFWRGGGREARRERDAALRVLDRQLARLTEALLELKRDGYVVPREAEREEESLPTLSPRIEAVLDGLYPPEDPYRDAVAREAARQLAAGVDEAAVALWVRRGADPEAFGL